MKKVVISLILAVITLTVLCSCVPSGQMCMICGNKKATKEYENALGMEMYVCSDCYKEVMELNRGN